MNKRERGEMNENIREPVTDLDIEMVYVEGGIFMMGATTEQESEYSDDESSVHQVTVSSFHIGKYPITQAQWKTIMVENPSHYTSGDLPVENVSWHNAQMFIRKLNAKTGKQYRLPTEAEWEFAARGGNKSNGYKYSGSNLIADVAWYNNNSGYKTRPVGTKAPNELGIYDMSGNVWEWCQDWYGKYPASAQIDPQGPSSGDFRVRRGGSWRSKILERLNVSYRYYYFPDSCFFNIGFRVALT